MVILQRRVSPRTVMTDIECGHYGLSVVGIISSVLH